MPGCTTMVKWWGNKFLYVYVTGARHQPLRPKFTTTEIALLQHILHGQTSRQIPQQVQHINIKSFSNEHYRYCYEDVRRWTRNFDIFELDKIFIPIHIRNHWTLAVVHISTKQIHYYDSMSDDEGTSQAYNHSIFISCPQEELFTRKACYDGCVMKQQETTSLSCSPTGHCRQKNVHSRTTPTIVECSQLRALKP